MAKKKIEFDSVVDLTKQDDAKSASDAEALEKLSAGLPDPATTKLERFKKRPRVAMTFKVPDLIKDQFCEKAIELGYTRKISGVTVADQTAMLYHMMREIGLDVPGEEFIDARRN